MNMLELLNHVTSILQTEAERGPGTVFLMVDCGIFSVTRTPPPDQPDSIVASYDCQAFCKGLSGRQYAALMYKADKAFHSKSV